MKKSRQQAKLLNAFTLIELIVALSVAAISLAIATDLFRSLRENLTRQTSKMNQQQEVFDGFSLLFSDLSQALIDWPEIETDFVGGSGGDNLPTSYLDFTALSPCQALDGSLGISRPHRVSYLVAGDVVSGQGQFVRTVVPLLGKTQLSGLTSTQVLSEQVSGLRISYWDGNEQRTDWTLKDKLPTRVDVFLSTNGGDWSISIVPQASTLMSKIKDEPS